MENKIINLNYEDMSSEQLEQIQQKIKEARFKKVEKSTAKNKDAVEKLKTELKLLNDDNENNKKRIEELKKELKTVTKETNQITKTLITHGKEKNELERHLHKIIYKEIGKGTTKDQLFHGDLTRLCKHSICESLNVGSFPWIEVKDIDMAKRLAYKCLNKVAIHKLMREKTKKLQAKLDKIQSTNKKPTERETRKFQLLEDLLDEIEGNPENI